jgi:hypothetical protein
MARTGRIGRIERTAKTFVTFAQFVLFVFSGNRLRFLMVPLVLLIFVVFIPPYAASFIGDDYVQLDRISDLLARPWAAYELLNPFRQSWYYRPLQNLWFLANRLLFGLNPFPFYYLQIAFHVLVMALVYRVARQLKLAPAAALAATLLYGFHGHFFDVVTWLSSIGIVLVALFSLAAVSAFLSYLEQPAKGWLLAATLLFVLLAMLSHEEGFLVVPFLLVLWWLRRAARPSPRFIAAFLVMFLLVVVYVGLQLIRPNLNITLSQTDLSHWGRYLSPDPVSQFLVHALVRTTTLFGALGPLLDNSYLAGSLLLVGLAYWFWSGSEATRLGLLWLALHLGFIYWAVWAYQPQFFAGRHLYTGLIGLHLALGALLQAFLQRPAWTHKGARQAVAGATVLALLFFNVQTIGQMHAIWWEMSRRDQEVRQQMQQLMPRVSGDTHVFAHRFVSDASYLPATVQVWYDQPLTPPGGSLGQLLDYGRATRDFYLFDYDDGRLINLMPELQEHAETIFIWHQPPARELLLPDGQRQPLVGSGRPALVIAGPAGDQRLALFTPLPEDVVDGWLSLGYNVLVPAHSELRLALRRPVEPGGVAYRIRLTTMSGSEEVLFEQRWQWAEAAEAGRWHDVVLSLDAHWNQTVSLTFEVQDNDRSIGGGYWANMRFVSD